MKKIFTLLVLLGILYSGYAQQRAPVNRELYNKSVVRKHLSPYDEVAPGQNQNFLSPGVNKDGKLLGDETEIIETVYDLQTNTNLANRFWVWEDGTMAAVCTRGVESPAGFAFPDRGTGYNFFDGSAWGPKPSARIEAVKTGWPSIAPWGENGEIIVSHNFPSYLLFSYRETKGTGTWETMNYNGPGGGVQPSWARMVTSGENNNYLSMVYNTYNAYQGQTAAMLYSRYNKDTQTWDFQDVILDGTGIDYYLEINADDYVMASKGDIVVILCSSAWFDLFMLKSPDNGETWEKTIIWNHPYPFFDFNSTLMSDTLYTVDNSATCAIDDNGMVHVVWGIGRAARLAAAPPEPGYYNYWPYTDGVGYWNESMGQIPENDNVHHTMMPEYLESIGMLAGWTQDVNNSGFIFDYEGTGDPQFPTYRSLGISTMPSIAINGGMIALAYASTTETFVTADGTMNYKHIWTRFSYDLGETWGNFCDLNADNLFHVYDECIYPVVAPDPAPDGAFQLIYQADNAPDLYLDEELQLEPTLNRIIHNSMNFTVGLEDQSASISDHPLLHLYPNPAGKTVHLTVDLTQPANVVCEIFSMTGQKIIGHHAGQMNKGINAFDLDISSLSSGIYFCTITDGIEKVTKKLIVK